MFVCLFVCLFHLFFIPLKYSTSNNLFVWVFAIVVSSFLNKNSLHTMVANMANPLRKAWFFVNNMNTILIFFPYSWINWGYLLNKLKIKQNRIPSLWQTRMPLFSIHDQQQKNLQSPSNNVKFVEKLSTNSTRATAIETCVIPTSSAAGRSKTRSGDYIATAAHIKFCVVPLRSAAGWP